MHPTSLLLQSTEQSEGLIQVLRAKDHSWVCQNHSGKKNSVYINLLCCSQLWYCLVYGLMTVNGLKDHRQSSNTMHLFIYLFVSFNYFNKLFIKLDRKLAKNARNKSYYGSETSIFKGPYLREIPQATESKSPLIKNKNKQIVCALNRDK